MSATCLDCGVAAERGAVSGLLVKAASLVTSFAPAQHTGQCSICKRTGFCDSCLDFALIQNLTPPFAIRDSVCFACFKSGTGVVLDWSRHEDVYASSDPSEAASGAEASKQPVILLHGGGGSRMMFASLARSLADTGKFVCVCCDLPGHGTRVRQPLTTDSAIKVVMDAVTIARAVPGVSATKRPILIGASFGGYLAGEVVLRRPQDFAGVVSVVAGQAVGTRDDAGFAARSALGIAKSVMPMFSSATMISMLIKAVPFDDMRLDLLLRESLQPSMYFQQQRAQIELLQSTNSTKAYGGSFAGPVLFINGELDHRDMEQKLLQLAKARFNGNEALKVAALQQRADLRQKIEPRLIVAAGQTHFLTHSKAHADKFRADVGEFVAAVYEVETLLQSL
jgi:pimeloyl-ACP methyl ester carboxylesterase